MISATFPFPPTKGGTQVRTYNLLKYLQRHHEVTIATLRDPSVSAKEVLELRDQVSDLVLFDRPISTANRTLDKVQRFKDFLQTGTPPSVRSNYSPELNLWIQSSVKAGKFDAITCEHSVNEIYVDPNWQQNLITTVNIHSSVYATCKNQLDTKTAEKPLRDRINLPLLKRYEKGLSQKFTNIVVTTQEDAQQFKIFSPQTPIAVIPNGVDFVDFPYRTTDPANHDLIFIGAMDNLSNIDAATYLAREIYPNVRSQFSDARLLLVGSRPVPEVLALAKPDRVIITGAVPSMAEYLHQASVCVIPMRTGFGIKNKTLEAMAAGTPVVASDRGLEGLEIPANRRALRANTTEDYVNAIAQLFTQTSLRQTLSESARDYIEESFTWEQAGRNYEAIVTQRA